MRVCRFCDVRTGKFNAIAFNRSTMASCGKCGAENPDDGDLCRNCGEKLVPASGSGSAEKEPGCSPPSDSDIAGEDAKHSGSPAGAGSEPKKAGILERLSYVPKEKVKPQYFGYCRVAAWILIAVAYCIGAYALFGCKIEYSNGVDTMQLTLFETVTGGYGIDGGILASILLFLGIAGFALTFTGYGAVFGEACLMILFRLIDTIKVGADVFESQYPATCQADSLLYLTVACIAMCFMSYAAMTYIKERDCYKYGGVLDFLRGRSD